MNYFHRRGAFARVLREELPIRLDRGFGRAQYGNVSASLRRLRGRDGQCDIGPDDGRGRVADLRKRGPQRRARQNDGIGIGREFDECAAGLRFDIGAEAARAFDPLT
ncbi:hypothetical protein [Paraburkholderia sp.]|uniref:hypothetical protein n=1 Tax=Paraburkholderia sp. TaxID=1926495 RepID=UPI002F3E9F4B